MVSASHNTYSHTPRTLARSRAHSPFGLPWKQPHTLVEFVFEHSSDRCTRKLRVDFALHELLAAVEWCAAADDDRNANCMCMSDVNLLSHSHSRTMIDECCAKMRALRIYTMRTLYSGMPLINIFLVRTSILSASSFNSAARRERKHKNVRHADHLSLIARVFACFAAADLALVRIRAWVICFE